MSRALLLLLPSLSSAVACAAVAAIILGGSGWAYINENQLFYDQLFGIYGLKTLLLQAPDNLWNIRYALFGSQITYHISILAGSAIIGFIVYVLLEGFRRAAQTTSEELHETQDQQHKAAAREALQRLLLRIVALALWAMYGAIFFTILLPMCVIWTEVAIDLFESEVVSSLVRFIGTFLLLSIALHIHIVLARFMVLRPRIFGDADIEEAEHHRIL